MVNIYLTGVNHRDTPLCIRVYCDGESTRPDRVVGTIGFRAFGGSVYAYAQSGRKVDLAKIQLRNWGSDD